jgi:hypothetical protein
MQVRQQLLYGALAGEIVGFVDLILSIPAPPILLDLGLRSCLVLT